MKGYYSHVTSNGRVRMHLLGNRPAVWLPGRRGINPTAYCEATKIANEAGIAPNRMCLLQAVSNQEQRGHREIHSWQPTESGEWLTGDAVLIKEPGCMVMTQTADCLALFFYYTNKDNQRCILVHCGRPAGTPIDGRSIIHDALARVVPDGDVEHLEVLACGSICGRHLPHQDGQGRAQAEQYLHAYGEGVFCNAGKLELDMYEVLLHVLEGEGVVQEQITYFGPRCTYNARDMASHRQCIINGERRSTANTVMVTTH